MSLENLPEFLTIPETAALMRCHADTITALGKRGQLNIVSIGRARRVSAASIRALINQGAHGGAVSEGAANVNHA